MGEVAVEVDEILLLQEFLEANTKTKPLDSYFASKVTEQNLSVSVITSISSEMQDLHHSSLRQYCHQCGTSSCSLMKCTHYKRKRPLLTAAKSAKRRIGNFISWPVVTQQIVPVPIQNPRPGFVFRYDNAKEPLAGFAS